MSPRHKAKMHKAAWTPEARAKRAATFAARRAAKEAQTSQRADVEADYPQLRRKASKSPTADAIVFLREAEKAIAAAVRAGRKVFVTRAEMYALLALRTLEGEG